jgi:Beta-propeller repeat
VRGERREIAGNYYIDGLHRVSFSVPSYDRSAPLILDPVLDYSTYLGGTSTDLGNAIAVDGSGDAFVAGSTLSTDFPAGTNGDVTAPPSPNLGATFVAELNPNGTNLLYSTYLAGSTSDAAEGAFGIALDPSGNVYVTGLTFATNFPTTSANAFNAGPLTSNVLGTAYLTKLNPTMSGISSLLYSTYLAGTGGDYGNGVAADAAGNAYVAGETDSTDFPTANPLQSAPSNSNGTAFLSRVDTTKAGTASLIFSTYFGGNGANGTTSFLGYGDNAWGVATDGSQNAYLVGATSSTNSPATFITSATAYQSAPPVANTQSSVFVSNIDTTAGSLVYSTYLAGSTADQGFAIALGPSNVAYVTGTTNSIDFPVVPNPGAFSTTGAASGKAFVTLVVVDGTKSGVASVPYSTYLGGTGGDNGYAIKADSSGNAYVAGATASSDFPVTSGALQATLLNTLGDAFLAKLNPAGGGASDLLYATFYGGSGDGQYADQGYGIAIDSATPPNAYITGQTFSMDLPVFSALPTGGSLQGPSDAYVAKLSLIPSLTVTPSPFNFGIQQLGVTSIPQAFLVTNNTSSMVMFNSIAVTGVSPPGNTDFAISSDACSPSVAAGAPPCTVKVTFTPSMAAPESANLVITAVLTNGGQSSTDVFTVNLSGTGSTTAPGISFSPTSLPFAGQMLTTTSAMMPVTVTSSGLGPVTINTIAASGDFAQTNNCPLSPATLASKATCTINVTFAPTAVGARTGTLTITYDVLGSPQTIPLTGTGWDFQVTAPASETGKSPLMFNATMTPLGGFNQSVAFTCAAPTGTTCAVTSSVTAADGMTPQPVQVTLTRGSMGMLGPTPSLRTPSMLIWQIVPLLLASLLLFLVPKTRELRVRLGLATAIVLLITLAGCGGPSPITGTLTIKGTSSGTAGSESHSAMVAVTLK